MRTYEVIFVTVPNLAKEDIDALIGQAERIADSRGGKVLKIDKWGKRNLAYKIGKFKEGYYVLLTIEGDGAIISELERRFKVTDSVIRFLTVHIDEEMKWLEKMKVKRARKKRPSSPPQEAAGESMPGSERDYL